MTWRQTDTIRGPPSDRREPVLAPAGGCAEKICEDRLLVRRLRRTVTDMRPRSVIDYALARRATLADLLAGRIASVDVCDAHPYLLRAARYHGETTSKRCPVCRCADPLTHVTYTYGDELGESSGRVRATKDLPSLAARFSELRVYVVEVCTKCGWNHLTTSFVIGTGEVPAKKLTRRRAADT